MPPERKPVLPSVMVARGTLAFPLDMLRYDQCWPDDTASAVEIASSFDPHERFACGRDGTFKVVLSHGITNKNRRWTPDRWRSFGWTLFEK